ncbi:hypothetical protein LJR168_003862 [Pseudoxanthomonas sp. LjRoot168]|uniref:hypothetical protein n=1 Tax=unclassified Pseudoxanthomonas TaxID=2645906 RepID=UPI003ECF6851
MSYYEFQQGQQQERFSNDIAARRATRNANDANVRADQWMVHAQNLERRLAQAEDQLQRTKDRLTVRTLQNDVNREALQTLQAELRKHDAKTKLGDVEVVREANRDEVDRRLRGTGLWIEHTETEDLIHRG